MARRQKQVRVGSLNHNTQTRKNVPTEQTEPFMSDGDRAPEEYKPEVRFQEGPVLAWGRDDGLENVRADAFPLYIHEKVHPQAWIESLQAKPEQDLFSDFDGLPEDSTYKWYEYEGNWSNRIIKGDSISVMASLAKKEGYDSPDRGVQMFFYDPPYGIGFKSNFQPSTTSRNVAEKKESLPAEPQSVKAFRDTYKNGIHSYLDTIYRTANHARAIMKDSGSFFMQIGDANVNRCALILDEVFGSENRVAMIAFQKTGASSSKQIPLVGDYLLWYAKDKSSMKFNRLYEKFQSLSEIIDHMSSYAMVELPNGQERSLTSEERTNPDLLPTNAKLFRRMTLFSQHESKTGRSEPFHWNGVEFRVPHDSQWRVSHEGLESLAEQGRLVSQGDGASLMWKNYDYEIPGKQINNHWSTMMRPNDMHYVVETSEKVVERCILMTTDPGDLVMDITCGSGTTAYVAEKWGRRWITCDTSTIPIQLARQRLLTATYDWYLLSNSLEGRTKDAELSNSQSVDTNRIENNPSDPSKGFVYVRIPKISAGILAYRRKSPPIFLVDRPVVDRSRKRCAGPFTVESISPYRYVPPQQIDAQNELEENRASIDAVVDALAASGIAIGDTKISFESIEAGPPELFVTHTARVNHSDGSSEQAAILILADDQTCSDTLIRKAAQSVVSIEVVGMLVVVAFAFEPDARDEKIYTFGRMTILKAQANRDLMIGPLKLENNDRAIVAIGQPDIEINGVGTNQIRVRLKGWDTYDPATGAVRRGKEKTIDTWLIDTNYNGEAFFARRIHFPFKNGDNQIKRLKAAIARGLDQNEWRAVTSLESTPFDIPATKQIAVRIITTTGIEMTAVRDIDSL